MPDRTYDAIVVGGRLAGAATAMLLARAGSRVLVLDRGRYGSDALSTHAFMRGGVIQLSRWGVLDQLRAAGTPRVHRTLIRYGHVDEVVDIRPMPHCDALYAPRRSLLDRVLVDAAFRAGAEVRFGAAVTDLLRDEAGRVTGVLGRDRSGPFAARAPLTIGADGVRSTVAKLVGAPTVARGRHATALVTSWWSGLHVDGYQWLYAPGATGGIIPTNGGQACVWVGVPASSFPAIRGDLAGALRRTIHGLAPERTAELDAATRHGPVRGFPGIPGFLRRATGPGWALVGDAGSFKDPVSAHGMTDALRDAELLARAALGAADARTDLDRSLAGYERLRDELSHELLLAADRVASFDWTVAELRPLLLAMSAAMRAEVAHLSALDDLPARPPTSSLVGSTARPIGGG